MAKSIKATPIPEILKWAREDAGYHLDVVAKKLKITTEKLESWENGSGYPTMVQFRSLAKMYHRPIAIFYLPIVPKKFQALKDFRRMTLDLPETETPEFRFEIRQALDRREIALLVTEELKESPPSLLFTIKLHDDVEAAGLKIRELLGITVEQQKKFKNEYDALNTWRLALEDVGILVFQSSGISLKEMRGFSVVRSPFPIIGVNNKDTPNARIFTMLHEFVHLLLKDDGVCDLHDSRNKNQADQVEAYANAVAGAVLVPMAMLLHEDIVSDKERTYEWSDDDLKSLSMSYHVSSEVILRRLLIGGKTTPQYYNERRERFLQAYKNVRPAKKQKGGPAPSVSAVSKIGKRLTQLFLSGYYQEIISPGQLSDYFGVKLKHLPSIESLVYYHQGSKNEGVYAV